MKYMIKAKACQESKNDSQLETDCHFADVDLLLCLKCLINFGVTQTCWQPLELVNVKVDAVPFPADFKEDAHSSRPRAYDLIGWNCLNKLHYVYNPCARNFIRKFAGLQCDVEVCFHGDE